MKRVIIVWLCLATILSASSIVIDTDDASGTNIDNEPLVNQVHNIDTDEYFTLIQEAIDDPDTLDGHSLNVSSGTYNEALLIHKALTITGEDKINTYLNGIPSSWVIEITSDWVNISRFTITDGWMEINNADYCCITDLDRSTSMYGGINLNNSHRNTIKNITCLGDVMFSIYLSSSSNNTISNCIINGATILEGVSLGSNSNNNKILNNVIDRVTDGIFVHTSHLNIIENNTISECHFSTGQGKGISLILAWFNTICYNDISFSDSGIYISGQNNVIFMNNITNNFKGFKCRSSNRDNQIHHNNIIDNDDQIYFLTNPGNDYWDDGYPSGGNYWSDFSGNDVYSGPNQDMPGADGLSDTPRSIYGSTKDHYPLMLPIEFEYASHDISLIEGWNLISLPLEQSDESIDQVLRHIAGKWDCIQIYDPLSSEPWKTNNFYKPEPLNDFNTLNHKIGFWINITEPVGVNFHVIGNESSLTSIHLYSGWNLVGYPTLTEKTVADALWGTGADMVEVFDPAEPYRIREVGPTYLMKPGEGYWVHVAADTIWIVDW